MFKGILSSQAPQLRRSQRRAAAAMAGKRRPHTARPPRRSAVSIAEMADVQRAQVDALREEGAWHRGRAGAAAASPPTHEAPGAGRPAPQSVPYDSVDAESGDSVVQLRFDALVHSALLRYGPPLPPEFVADNEVVTSSSATHPAEESFASNSRTGQPQRLSWQADLGADGRSFMMYDEVALKPHELLSIIRRHQPGFSVKEDCDGVPFSLLVRNCPYFRAFGGRVNYMRYLRRETQGGESQVVVSIAKYKMREAASQDGLRQGPQPWKYSYKML